MTYEDHETRIIGAQNLWKHERSGIYLAQHLAWLSTIFDGETPPTHPSGTTTVTTTCPWPR